MKKRRHGCVKNYLPSLKYSQTHERFLGKTRNTDDSKVRNSKRSYTKLQQKNKNCNDAPYLKKDAFYFLESLFDLKKTLNLKNVYSLAFNYHKEKSIETLNTTKSEPVVETLFLQSFSPRTDLEPPEPPFDECSNKNKERTRNKIETSEVLEIKISDSVQELQKNNLTQNQQSFSR
ncbi:uncharacterized protein LOC109857785 [Pseudomyrmex gracilis]|uniref:uncharacterized protein LOC109857785 n=1 Tax=Pseudomyrmex gracilis TaxID=219809 RepID=UPI0009952654|nr:uncharacterized protein LOC109857785 [Pseudomyrmex gracilis]